MTYLHHYFRFIVGATHDDVTIKGVAAAFQQKLVVNEEMLAHVRDMNDASPSFVSPAARGALEANGAEDDDLFVR